MHSRRPAVGPRAQLRRNALAQRRTGAPPSFCRRRHRPDACEFSNTHTGVVSEARIIVWEWQLTTDCRHLTFVGDVGLAGGAALLLVAHGAGPNALRYSPTAPDACESHTHTLLSKAQLLSCWQGCDRLCCLFLLNIPRLRSQTEDWRLGATSRRPQPPGRALTAPTAPSKDTQAVTSPRLSLRACQTATCSRWIMKC